MSLAKDREVDVSKIKIETDGSFERPRAVFHDIIEKGSKFEPGADRYHLYVSLACPWATRTLITRKLKGLEDIISTKFAFNIVISDCLTTSQAATVVSPRMGKTGWPFANIDEFPGAEVDLLYNSNHIKDLYFKVDPDYQGRFSVPILWDKKNHTIVNNESAEIIRMINTAFNDFVPCDKAKLDLYPESLRSEIDEVNAWVYANINNGVYRAGVARTQAAYKTAVADVFEALDRVETLLDGKDYLVGNQLTEADIRLFVTAIRFDIVYFGHFKCNIRTIRDGYPAIHRWMRQLYWNNDAFKSTTDFDHIKTHYYWSQTSINPSSIIPVGPVPHIHLL